VAAVGLGIGVEVDTDTEPAWVFLITHEPQPARILSHPRAPAGAAQPPL
jgi:hypothetical protein